MYVRQFPKCSEENLRWEKPQEVKEETPGGQRGNLRKLAEHKRSPIKNLALTLRQAQPRTQTFKINRLYKHVHLVHGHITRLHSCLNRSPSYVILCIAM